MSERDLDKSKQPAHASDQPAVNDQEVLAEQFKLLGIRFDMIPDGVYPRMLYITPTALVESGATKYSLPHITTLIKRREIPTYRIGSQVILEPEAVERLLERERDSLAGKLHPGGRRPGPESPGSRYSPRRRQSP